ncbi:hypothetical protein [Tenacibaculum amylolyticum]|uniref:hypothetical protein n=1 Tax=Tenacibaculum amylolyticum TaxID=104269 RepID=UPI0038953346
MYKKLIVLSFFGLYWGTTVFFTMPENYLQIKANRLQKVFSTMFYQKWSFFAPPPKHNDRFYYEFSNSKDTLLLEVIKPIHKLRKEQYLANNDISIVDYILSNSINNISDIIREKYGNYKFINCENTDEEECFGDFLEKFDEEFYQTNELKTLRNYGLSIFKGQELGNYDKMKMSYTVIDIPKFAQRYSDSIPENEKLIFETKYFDLKNNLWIK